MDLIMRWVASAATAGFVAFAVTAPSGSNYRYAAYFLIPLTWAVYFLRRRVALHPLHFTLFAAALLLHNLRALGYYQKRILWFTFDNYVHTYFGFVGGLMIYRLLERRFPLTAWPVRIGTLMFVMGAGAIHEIVEWASTMLLGPEVGMLKPQNEVHFDTHRDLFSNLLGVTAAVLAYTVGRRARPSPADRA